MPLAAKTISQYHKLRALQKDQDGKPEGSTAGSIADRLLEKHPELAASRAPADGSAPTPNEYAFTDFLRTVAKTLGIDTLDDMIEDINRDFPGLIDEVVKQAQGNGNGTRRS